MVVQEADSVTRMDMEHTLYEVGPGVDGGKDTRTGLVEWHTGDSNNDGWPQLYVKDFKHTGGTPDTAVTPTTPSEYPSTIEFGVDRSGTAPKDSIIVTVQVATPLMTVSSEPADTIPADNLKSAFADTLGSVFHISCFGEKVFDGQDTYDSNASSAFQNGTALAKSTDVYQSSDLNPAATCADSNSNGLPDEYETRLGGGVDPDSVTVSGFLLIEHLLEGLSIPNHNVSGDTAVWVDSTFAAIFRDCYAGKVFPVCERFDGSSGGGGGSIIPIIWRYKLWLFLIAYASAMMAINWWYEEKRWLMQRAQRYMLPPQSEISLLNQEALNALSKAKHRRHR